MGRSDAITAPETEAGLTLQEGLLEKQTMKGNPLAKRETDDDLNRGFRS